MAPEVLEEAVRHSGGAAPIRARLIAGILDSSVVLVALGIFLGVFHAAGGSIEAGPEGFRTLTFSFLGLLFFYWIFYVRYVGETAGMTWMRLRIVTLDGRRPTGLQKWIRAGGTILSCCAAGLGFLWSLADEDRLTWHDRISRTHVIEDRGQGPRRRSHVGLARPRSGPRTRAARRA